MARSGGRVVGFVGLAYEDKPWGLSCEVKTLVVDEDRRGRGLGTALMRAAERKLTAADRADCGSTFFR